MALPGEPGDQRSGDSLNVVVYSVSVLLGGCRRSIVRRARRVAP